ncbi:hypothetical protein Tco_1190459, partial [Tanacetum coccineum]
MTTLQFADTYNLVAFLTKSTESEGFKQILQALVDGKNIVVIEASGRRDLQLEDVNGVDCLPNATIFEQLTLMGAKTTAWNEFSSTMASAIISLADNQKFNFSKYIFESMIKNLDSAVKFLMYPRFVQKLKPRKPKKKDTQIPQSNVPSNNLVDKAINEENVSKHSNNPFLSGEDRLKLKELMVGLSVRVVSSKDKCLGEEDASKQERKIHDIDVDDDITLENVHDEDMFDTIVFNNEEVFVGQDMAEKEVSTADLVTTVGEVVTTTNVEVSTAIPTTATISIVELTLAQTLEERIAREKEEDNAALITQWNDIQDKVETDYELAQRLQADETKEESGSKRTREELESDKSKKQKLDEKVEVEVDDAKEAEELKKCLEIVPDDGDDVTIDAIPLSVKILIVNDKIYQEGKKSFFKIIRADGKTHMHLTFRKKV